MSKAAQQPAFVKALEAWVLARGGEARPVRYKRQGGGSCEAFWAKPQGAPRGVIVVLHATGNDKFFTFVQIYRELVSAGYAVFAFDLDGHGHASTHRLSRGHIDSMLPQALNEARKLAPGLKVHLLGQSLGALLAMRFLLASSERNETDQAEVTSAMLLSAPVSGRILTRSAWRELFAVASLGLWRAVPIYGPWGIMPALGPFKRSSYPLRFGIGPARISAYAGFVDDLAQEFSRGAQEIDRRCPCLLLYGALDAVTPAAQAEPVRERLRATSAWQVVPGETHFTLPFSRTCRRRLNSWLNEHS